MEINKIYCESNVVTLSKMDDEFIDMVITSPPYDDLDSNLVPRAGLRDYNGYQWQFKPLVNELYRTLKSGGICVWVVGDRVVKGSETGTSFRQALHFIDTGFRLFDTMIYKRHSPHPPNVRYWDSFEYMFVFSKGKPKTFNPIMQEKKKYLNSKTTTHRKKSGDVDGLTDAAWERKKKANKRSERIADNIWEIPSGYMKSTTDVIAYQHDAIFPEILAENHILSWSNKGDLVYDPFMGSGTTAKMCVLNNRRYIGSEISEEYCAIARERVKTAVLYGRLR